MRFDIVKSDVGTSSIYAIDLDIFKLNFLVFEGRSIHALSQNFDLGNLIEDGVLSFLKNHGDSHHFVWYTCSEILSYLDFRRTIGNRYCLMFIPTCDDIFLCHLDTESIVLESNLLYNSRMDARSMIENLNPNGRIAVFFVEDFNMTQFCHKP